MSSRYSRLLICVPALVGCLTSSGCLHPLFQNPLPAIAASTVPRELEKVTLPIYRVEPPDILLIEAVQSIRPADAPLRAGDQISIQASNTLPQDPEEDPVTNQFRVINAIYVIQPNGMVDLGPEYGQVDVEGLTLAQAQDEITSHLEEQIGLTMPRVSVSLPDLSGKQPVAGEHLVRPDGTVSLGVYGSVFVAGLTLDETRSAVEEHLAKHLHDPEVNVDVLAYNSKTYYIITDGGGFGEQISSFPCTGNETVLDALAQIQGLSQISSKKIWVSRPAPAGADYSQIMMVDYRAISQDGITTTNYQLFPGDRIYIVADHLVAFDNLVTKVTAPIERIFGFVLLGNGVVRRLQTNQIGGGTGGGGF
jgi:protein involved in polysaccharide export with SLBB domain